MAPPNFLPLVASLAFTASLLAAPPAPPPPSAPAVETAAQHDARMAWWREARFGMFIHWGLYAIPAGEWNGKPVDGVGEWIMLHGKIPAAEYEKLAGGGRFNPVKFDAAKIVGIARDAGMKYIVITSKHHDGFCLWDSALTDYDIMATPFKRDILKELSAECEKQGIRMCFYHSIMDWHHPDYAPRRAWDPRPELPPPDMDKYQTHIEGQVKELLTNYGGKEGVGVMWFDGEWENSWTSERGKRLYEVCRAARPGVIVNNRVAKARQGMSGMSTKGEFAGDFGTPEQEVPANGLPGVDWESCMTMNDSWGFKRADTNFKSSEELIRTLIDIASKGGNFLLNVGPTAEGEIPGASIERLAAVGAWMKINGESIHGTHAGPFRRLPWGRCTAKANPGGVGGATLYFHVFDWPTDGMLRVPGLASSGTVARRLGSDEKYQTRRDGVDLLIDLGASKPSAPATVLAINVQGDMPVVAITPIRPRADGSLVLDAADAELNARAARIEEIGGRHSIGYWVDPGDEVFWIAAVKPGTYTVELVMSCEPGSGGDEFEIQVGDKSLRGTTKATKGWSDFVTITAGKVTMEMSAQSRVSVKPSGTLKHALMNLREVRLVPTDNAP